MTMTTQTAMIGELCKALKRLHYPLEVMLVYARWHAAYPLIFRRRKRPVGGSWRIDETYIQVARQWKYLYRAVDMSGDKVDFLLTAKRDLATVSRYLEDRTTLLRLNP